MKRSIQVKKIGLAASALLIAVLSLFSGRTYGQTPVPMALQAGLTFTESFGAVSSWSDNFVGSASGESRWKGIAVAGSTGIPSPTVITQKTTGGSTVFATTSTGGVQKGGTGATAYLIFLATGGTDNSASTAVDFYMDFTGVNAGTLSFTAAELDNSTSSNRAATLKVYYTIDGMTFTELTGTNLPFTCYDLVASSASISVALPAAFNNVSTARLRFYVYNGGTPLASPTGSRPKITIDNLTVTATSAGCSTAPTSLSATPSSGILCTGATLTLTGAATGATSYSWTGPNSFSSTLLSPAAITVSTASAGAYTLSAINSCGTSTVSSIAIAVNTPPTVVTATPSPTSLCTGATLTLTGTATGATSYIWSGPNSYTSTLLSPAGFSVGSVSGSYTLAATNSCGTTTVSSTPVTITSPTPGTISGTTNITVGTTATLTASGTAGGTWTTTTPTLATITSSGGVATGLATGTAIFSYSVTNSCGTVSTGYSVTISASPPIISSVGPNSAIPGATVTITGNYFDGTPANNIVYFGATKATVTGGSTTTLTVTVPVGATFSNLSVLNNVNHLTGYELFQFMPAFNASPYTANTANFVNAFTMTSGSSARSVAIGDIDGDGKADLIVANAASILVYKNNSVSGSLASTSFGSAISLTSTGVSNVLGVRVADLDGDGKLDVIGYNAAANGIFLYHNNYVSGTLSSSSFGAVPIVTSAACQFLTIGDLDGDGRPEIVTANTASGFVSVLRNTTVSGGSTFLAGSFAAGISFSTGTSTSPLSIAIGDLDGDNKPEIIAATYFAGVNKVAVFRNTSSTGGLNTSSFAAATTFTTGNQPASVAVGDLDGDGKLDIVTANTPTGTSTISVLRNTTSSIGSITFQAKVDFATGAAPRNVAVADINGDGKPDIVTCNLSGANISVFTNTVSSGIDATSFATKRDFNSGTNSNVLAIGDLDGDNRPDIAVIDSTASTGTLSVLRSIPDAPSISAVSPTSAAPGATVVITGTNFGPTPTNNKVFFGATQATVNAGASTTLSLTVTVPSGATLAPITVTNPYNLTAYQRGVFTPIFANTYFKNDSLNFKTYVPFTAGNSPYSGAIGDLNGDGKPDMVVNNTAAIVTAGGPSISVFRNVSSTGIITGSSFTLSATLTSGIGTLNPNNVKLADLDGDGKLDIIVPVVATPPAVSTTFFVYLNTTAALSTTLSFTGPTAVSSGFYTSVATITDFDGDGRPDVALSSGASTLNVVRNTSSVGSISFDANVVSVAAGSVPSSVCFADLDGDGKPDIAGVNSGYAAGPPATYSGNTATIAKNTSTVGAISFGTPATLTTGSGAIDIAAGDINNDGRTDLVVTNINDGTFSTFINSGVTGTITTASFGSAVNTASGASSASQPTGIALSDLNGDGKLDVVVTNNHDNSVSMFRNIATGTTLSLASAVNYASGPNPTTVTIGDLDADGYPDIVTGNSTTVTVSVIKNYPVPIYGTTSGAATVCAGSTATYTNSATGVSGIWAVTNSTLATINSSTGVLTGLAGGSDSIIYKTYYGYDTSHVYTPVTIYPAPAPTLSGTATIASGGSTTLTFTGTSGDVVYYWNGASTVNTTLTGGGSIVTVSPTVTTTYSVTSATSALGCTASISGVNVTVTISAVADTTPTRDDNMAMGNPSAATSSLSDSNNYLMVKSQYALAYNNAKGEPRWVSWHLSRAWKGDAARCDCFTADALLPSGYYHVGSTDYSGSGFDRGHLCPSDDRDASDTDNAVTFKMTNMTPQSPNLNEITWGSLESYCRALIYSGNELYIIAGGYGTGGTGSLGGTTTTLSGTNISVPSHFFKVIVVLPVGVNDVSRVTNSTRVIAVDMPNTQTVNAQPWTYYRTSVDAIEAATGYDFLNNVSVPIQAVVEAGIDNGPSNILAWDFNGANSDTVITAVATSIGNNLDTSSTYNKLTRGATATASTGANSFRTTGFSNNGISTANTDYFETKMRAASGYELSLSTIDATFAGTSTFSAGAGVSSQFAYSLDGTTYTLINSPTTNIGTPAVMASVNVSAITALQHVASTTPIYLRYYASGQTTTGGWGFYSQYVGNYGLSIDGTSTLVPCSSVPTGVSATLSSTSVCSGSTITLTGAATVTGSPYYSWTGPNGFTSTDLNPAAITTGTASAGVYTLVASNGCGSTTATTAALVINTAPTIVSATLSATNVCSGATLTLTGAATGATAYAWTGPNSFTSTDLSPTAITTSSLSAGIYTLVASNSCGSTTATSTSVVITSGVPVIGAITGAATVVAGSAITLSDTTLSGTWSSSNNTIATITAAGVVTGVSAGLDTISYAKTNVCGTGTATYAVTVTPAPITLVGWNVSTMPGGTDNFGPSPLSASTTATHVTVATALTRGSGIATTGASGAARGWGGVNWQGTSTATAVSGNDFVSFAIKATSGYNVSLSSYTINYRRSGTGASAGQLQYSLDGTTFVDAGSALNYASTAGGGATIANVDLSGISALQNVASSTTLTFRLANYGGTGTTGTWYVYDVASSTADDMFFTGLVAANCTTAPTAVTATPSSTTICSGAALTLTGAGVTADSFTWAGPNTFSSTLQNPVITTSALSAGIYTLTASNLCGNTTVTTSAVSITTTPTAVSAAATPSTMCSGSTLTLTGAATGATSYSWSGPGGYLSTTLNPAAVTTSTASAGVYTLAAANSCGTTTATTSAVVINPIPAPTIAGTTTILFGGSTTLTFSGTSGDTVYYSWTGGSHTTINIGGTGSSTVSVSPTTNTTYTIDSARSAGGCFAIISGAVATITVGPACTVSPTGVSASLSSATLCDGATLTLTGAATSSSPATYAWTGPNSYSSTDLNPAAVTVNTASAGIYTLVATNACGSTTVTTSALTITTTPTAVTATPSATALCAGATLTLTGAATGATSYSWNGPGGFTSAVNPVSVTTTTTSAGVYTVTATNSCGSSTATTTAITVTGTPTVAAISGGTVPVVIGSTLSLTDATPSGIWSINTPSIATIGATGVVTGVSAGGAIATYTVNNSCFSNYATTTITVAPVATTLYLNNFPTAAAGDAPSTLNSNLTTGAWTAVLTPAGTTVSLTSSAGATGQALTGTGAATGVTSTWTLPLNVNSGYSMGITSFTFWNNHSGTGYSTYNIYVNTTLVGTGSTTSGSTITVTLSGATLAAVSNLTGTNNIKIAWSGGTNVGGTVRLDDFTVKGSVTPAQCTGTPAAGNVTGSATICGSGSRTLTFTPGAVASGLSYQWASSSTGVSFTPIAGATSVTYTTPTVSSTTYYRVVTTCSYSGLTNNSGNDTITINPLPLTPAPITGTTAICAGTTTTLADTSAGGVWSSGATSVATVDASGMVTAIAPGTATISYTVTNSCGSAYNTALFTVNPLPSAGTITGPSSVCVSTSTLFTDTTAGGVWSSSDPTVASVDAAGNVSGIIGGSATISYSYTNGCGTAVATLPITVNTTASAGAISGTSSVCPGTMTTLTDGTPGGTWASANSSIATVNASGVVTGVMAGSVAISYTVTTLCGTATTTLSITVVPVLAPPAAITGTTTVCPGISTTLSDATSGGAWTTSDAVIATVNTSGVATGLVSGSATLLILLPIYVAQLI